MPTLAPLPRLRRALSPATLGAVVTALAAVPTLRLPLCGPALQRWCRTTQQAASPRPSGAPAERRRHHGDLFPAERAIVSPLTVGAALGPATVFELAHHFEARIMVGVRCAGREGWLRVTRAAGAEVPARVEVGPFALTVERGALTEAELDAAVDALAAVLRRNVEAPMPPEMQPLRRHTP